MSGKENLTDGQILFSYFFSYSCGDFYVNLLSFACAMKERKRVVLLNWTPYSLVFLLLLLYGIFVRMSQKTRWRWAL